MKRILAIKLRQLGDVVLWTAALKNLKEAYPESEIEVLVYDYAKPLLENQPELSKIHTLTGSLFLKFLELRKRRYDFVLGFHATASLCRLGWMFYPSTTIFHHHSIVGKPFWSKLKVPHAGELENVLLRDQRVLEALGIQPRFSKPSLMNASKNRSGIVLLPGASIETKRYPEDLWKKLVTELHQEGKKLAIACDNELSQKWDLKNFLKKLNIPLYDNLSLKDFVKKISEFEIAIANDSGPLHMAAALGLKTIALFGPTCVGDWHPYQDKINLLIRKHVDCRDKGPQDQDAFRYCTLETCSHHSCLKKIIPQEIKEKLGELT